MKKVVSNNLTAGMLSKNSKQRVKEFIAKDKASSFMSSFKSTPAYWKSRSTRCNQIVGFF